MIRLLISLLFVMVALAASNYCDKSTTYSSLKGDLPKGTTIDGYSQCVRKYLEAKGLLNNGTAFNYVVNNGDLSKLKWTLSDYVDQEKADCSECLPSGCLKADADSTSICKAVEDAKKQTQLGRKQIVSLAKPTTIIVIIVIYPGGVLIIIIW